MPTCVFGEHRSLENRLPCFVDVLVDIGFGTYEVAAVLFIPATNEGICEGNGCTGVCFSSWEKGFVELFCDGGRYSHPVAAWGELAFDIHEMPLGLGGYGIAVPESCDCNFFF